LDDLASFEPSQNQSKTLRVWSHFTHFARIPSGRIFA